MKEVFERAPLFLYLKMSTSNLLQQLENKSIKFKDVLSYIDQHYEYRASSFINGNQDNAADQNQGSAKVLSYAKLNNLSKEDTLKLFAEHYEAVLANPQGTDHQNIRQFMEHGWDKVSFEIEVLKPL